MNWRGIREYLLALAVQPSTYEGIVFILAGGGIALKPDQITHIAAAGAIVVGLIRAGSNKP